MLAGGNRRLHAGGAQRGQLRVEVDRVVRVRERAVQVCGPARHAVLLGDLLQLGGVAAHQDRIGNQTRPVRQRDATLLPNRQNGTDQMLVQPHASGDAVHDDADPLLVHCFSSA